MQFLSCGPESYARQINGYYRMGVAGICSLCACPVTLVIMYDALAQPAMHVRQVGPAAICGVRQGATA